MAPTKSFVPENWHTQALSAASCGLEKTGLGAALAGLLVSPSLDGGTADFEMSRDIGGGVYRSVLTSADSMLEIPAGFTSNNLSDLMNEAYEKYVDAPCLGRREVLDVEVNEKGHEFVTLAGYTWLNYKQVGEMAHNLGRGLVSLGVNAGDKITLFADTKLEWQVTAQACFHQGVVVSTSYANLGEEALVYAINQTESAVVFTDATLVGMVASVLDQCPSVKHIVYYEDARPASFDGRLTEDKLQKVIKDKAGVILHSFNDVIKLGEASTVTERPTVSAEDLAVIMYTSGSTGLPKGVMIAHKNLVAAMAGVTAMIPGMGVGDYYVAYLPLAHILEMIAEAGILVRGGAIGYGSTKTITDASVGLKTGASRGDAAELRPTLMAAVPAIMDKIRNGVTSKVKEAGGIKAKLFNKAFKSKTAALAAGTDSPFWNKLVFDGLRAKLLGGRLRFMLSGGGPLSKATQDFMNVVFCCPVGQGYGLTETCGSGTLVWPNDRTVGRVGAPIPSTQIKLVDWEEGGYFVDPSKNEDKSCTNPRGEVLFGGPIVTMGYYKLPEKTAEAYFTDDAGAPWFYTGDIGEFSPDGVLTLIDRKKDLVKLSGGEYVSYGKLEPLIRDSEYVDNVMVYADPLQLYCVAVVCRALGSSTPEDVILKDIQRILKANKVAKFEIPKKIKVVDEQWNPENDLATAALKLKRVNLQKHYKQELVDLYA